MQVAPLPAPACPLGSRAACWPPVATWSGPFLAFACTDWFVSAVWMPLVLPLPPFSTLPWPAAVPPPAGGVFAAAVVSVVGVLVVGAATAAAVVVVCCAATV